MKAAQPQPRWRDIDGHDAMLKVTRRNGIVSALTAAPWLHALLAAVQCGQRTDYTRRETRLAWPGLGQPGATGA